MDLKSPDNKQPSTPESTLAWISSNRLYEEYLFFYVIILSAFTAVGFYTFGFEIDGWTQPQNLAINFGFYILLAIVMCFTPAWYNVIWGSQARLDKRSEKVLGKIEAIEDSTLRQQTRQLYKSNGEMPPDRKQIIALILLFCFFNFELFFIGAWVKPMPNDMYLVWQPDWVTEIINWVRGHLNTPPLNISRDIFYFDIEHTVFSHFNNEQTLLSTHIANAGLFFHFWRFISCPIYLILYIILLWRTIDWLGVSKINPKNIRTIGQFLWVSFISIFMLMFLISTEMISRDALYATFPMILGKVSWLNYQWMAIYYVLTMIALKIFIGWFYFWKAMFNKLRGK